MFHLARRFIGYVTSKPPTAAELATVRSQLGAGFFDLFAMMSPQDQRHAIQVAARVGDDTLLEAALLHDIGKSVAHVGPVGRSCATIAGALSISVSGSWDLYLDHGAIGASMLETAGAEEITIAFARFHPGPPPPGVSPRQWRALGDADDI